MSLLTDLQYRVWTQYILSADDFGVMRASAVALQADNDRLANLPMKTVQTALDAVVKVGLIGAFSHQKHRFVFQFDWQSFQKVEYPRSTNEPKPDDSALARCNDATRALFAKHPGGTRKPRASGEHSEGVPNTSQDNSEDDPNVSEGRAEGVHPRGKRLTANGQRQPANGSEEKNVTAIERTPPMDEWARELSEKLYPQQGTCSWHLVERPLYEALTMNPAEGPWLAWENLKARLETHKRSHQWRVKQMIPRLDRYLQTGAHLQQLPEHPVDSLVSSKSARTLSSAAAILKGDA